ncbi:hypothetical protein CF327_g1426 [Tilletia walkeri]|nr:hypothetical protein CF327_g1426 [Tilletia walkeri]
MTQTLHHYRPEVFHALPSVEQAAAMFTNTGGISKIEEALGITVQKYPTAASFGIQLLHRHSPLSNDEIMLAWQGTSIPLKVEDISAAKRNSNVVPITWGLDPHTGSFVPLEFALVEDKDKVPMLDGDLAKDVADFLKVHGLARILGLALLPSGSQAGAEISVGRANVVLPADSFASLASFIEVLWPLCDPSGSSRRCMLFCHINPYTNLHEQFHYGQ